MVDAYGYAPRNGPRKTRFRDIFPTFQGPGSVRHSVIFRSALRLRDKISTSKWHLGFVKIMFLESPDYGDTSTYPNYCPTPKTREVVDK